MIEPRGLCRLLGKRGNGTYPSGVELGLGSMVGRTMTRDMSRGGCGLRKS